MSKFLDSEGLKVFKEKDDETYLKEKELEDITRLPSSSSVEDTDLLIKGSPFDGELSNITVEDFISSIKPEILADSKYISSTAIAYQVSSSGSSAPTGTWSSNPVATSDGQYLWTRVIFTYADNTTDTFYMVSKAGETGAKGDTGEKGDKGDQGEQGEKGDAGENGKDCAWNILRGTNSCTELVANNITDMWDRAEWGASTVNGTMEGRESVEINDAPIPDIKLGWRFSNATSLSENFNIVQSGIPYIDGEIYTLSTYARGHGTLRLALGSVSWTSDCDVIVDSEEWTRISVTGSDTTGQARVLFALLGDGTEQEIEICGMKLEAGEYATEWAPSTYDLMCTAITEEQIDLMFLPRVDDETLYYYDAEATVSGTTVTVAIDSAYSYVQSTTYYVAETIDILLEM